jgi:hypothetical protein
MEYNSTLPYDTQHTYNADYEMWFVGDAPVLGGYLGDTQVYPPKAEEPGKPSDGLYISEAGWNLGIQQSMYPLMNRVGITTTAMEGINYLYFSKTKSNYGAFTESNIKAGQWFLLSNDDGRYYGQFTGSTYDDGSVIGARCEHIESYGQFVPGKENYVLLGYFGQFKAADDDRLFDKVILDDE